MLVTMLYRYAGSPEMTGETSFSDVREGRYFYQAVIWAEKNQIANGYPDGTFQPNQNITREQMVTMLFRYVQSQDGDNGLRDDLAAFEDGTRSAILPRRPWSGRWPTGWSTETATTLAPKGQATRAQTATVLYRTLANL